MLSTSQWYGHGEVGDGEIPQTNVQRIVGITISNSQVFLLGFSFRSSPLHLWVIRVYIVWVQKVCIRQYSLAEQKVSQVSRGKSLYARYSRNIAVSICIDSLHSSHVQGTCFLSRDAQSRDTCENPPGFNCLSLHTFSHYHITLTINSHNKYRVHKSE